MDFDKKYELDMEEIREGFIQKKNHIQCNRYKLFPFIANDSKLVDDFKGVNGAFSRGISNKIALKSDAIDINNIIVEIQNSIANTENEKYAIKSMIESMFVHDNKFINFDIRVLNYLESSSFEEKIANFLASTLLEKDTQEVISSIYNVKTENIMHKLILEYLPNLKENKKSINSNWALNFNIAREYFNNRKTYNLGMKMLEKSMNKTFSHAITLEFLNISNIDEQLNYIDLYNCLNDENSQSFIAGMRELIDDYKSRWSTDTNWDGLLHGKLSSDKEAYNLVYELFEAVDYQFTVKGSKRAKAYKSYSNWIVKFMQNKFGKTRGASGYVLTLSEDDIILFTKIIMNNLEKMKLKTIFEEFEIRGIFFDRDSKEKVLQLYEKLNIIEKKSDSGDAIYVKTIL